MSSNLSIWVEMPKGNHINVVFPKLEHCIRASGFILDESAEEICRRGSKIGRDGHLTFVILLRSIDGPVTVWLKFCDYGLISRIVFEPGNRLSGGALSYTPQDHKFILAVHELAQSCFKELNAEEAAAYLDDIDEPWFRFSKASDPIPLPELVIDPEAEE